VVWVTSHKTGGSQLSMTPAKRVLRHVVGNSAEIPPGGRKVVQVAGRRIGVFNVKGRYYALRDSCPHQGAPLCTGVITGTARPNFVVGGPPVSEWVRAGEILRCPWHNWEFDIFTGKAISGGRFRVATYEVYVASLEQLRASGELKVVNRGLLESEGDASEVILLETPH